MKYIHGSHSAMRNKDKGATKPEKKKTKNPREESNKKKAEPCKDCRGL